MHSVILQRKSLDLTDASASEPFSKFKLNLFFFYTSMLYIHLLIIKLNNFRGDLTDVSAKISASLTSANIFSLFAGCSAAVDDRVQS